MVQTECAEMAAVSHGTSHVRTKQRYKYTTSVDIKKHAIKATNTHLESYATYNHSLRIIGDKSVVSLPESGK